MRGEREREREKQLPLNEKHKMFKCLIVSLIAWNQLKMQYINAYPVLGMINDDISPFGCHRDHLLFSISLSICTPFKRYNTILPLLIH
jgi:hypothetical protein